MIASGSRKSVLKHTSGSVGSHSAVTLLMSDWLWLIAVAVYRLWARASHGLTAPCLYTANVKLLPWLSPLPLVLSPAGAANATQALDAEANTTVSIAVPLSVIGWLDGSPCFCCLLLAAMSLLDCSRCRFLIKSGHHYNYGPLPLLSTNHF